MDHCTAQVADAGWPFNAASSASSSAMRASREARAAATSAASNFCGMCCGQLVSHAEIRNRIDLLGPRLVAFRHQRLRQRRVVIDDARLAPDLDAAAVRIVHHEDMRLRVLREIALRDVLPVAAVVGERDRVLVEDFDKALRPAAMLDIGMAVGRWRWRDRNCWSRPGSPRGFRRSRCASRRSLRRAHSLRANPCGPGSPSPPG